MEEMPAAFNFAADSLMPQGDDPFDDPSSDQADQNFGKGSTWMMEADGPATDEDRIQVPQTKPKYVQGVVQGQQVFLITNLLKETSQTLLQPQMVWTIGRNREAAIPIQDRRMSRRHAVILYVPGQGFCLVDLNSMNGSYVNGERIQHRHILQDGDYITVGNTDFFFFSSGCSRSLDAIHPEVFARLKNLQSRNLAFVDFSALEEPEISFNLSRG
jgi:pSer/pThr/pTyr-binding forkhead associated (FHA) protein